MTVHSASGSVAEVLEKQGIETEIFQAGNPDMENVKAAAAKMAESDALVIWFSSLLGISISP